MKFAPRSAFDSASGYRLLPMRFRRLPWDETQVLVTSLAGDWLVMPRSDLDRAVAGELQQDDVLFASMEARHLILADPARSTLAPLLSQYRTRKAYLQAGPALHIFVVSLRCHHTCSYCQVSRRPTSETTFDMSGAAGRHAVERLFEWPSDKLTVEFQGGEPLLHFDRIRSLTEAIVERNRSEGRSLRFVIASTLHDLTDDQLAFMREHRFQLSTSLDGPEWLHNANRPRPERDSYRRTIEGIEHGRRALGEDAVSALTTLTARSLTAPREIIDEYRKQGLHSIFLRPLSPYGFARKTQARQGYPITEFLTFYSMALDHILSVNQDGFELEEAYASLLLSQLLTPFSHGYVDLRSPTGAGLGTVVYDYDGQVYPSDEARMLAAMGAHSFAMGRVDEPVAQWLQSPAMQRVLAAGVAEALPTCADCAYVPLCGADPIDHYARQGDPIGHRPTSDFCAKQMGLFDLLLQRWQDGSAADRAVFETWALRQSGGSPAAVPEAPGLEVAA
ncbi:His-Xaa-Ser system radical SAM maturase HxsB [Lysobacter firmicutimachus]|uniref:His-Xaa-Ser system radical SAM maturase HxsB n=1 Tax=Lysobacter firmicutimachus TaxID=1792846 RepID=A0ABU8CY44_9GAMM